MWKIAGLYLLAVNLLAFVMYGVDKKRAIEQKWRIPEKTLILLAMIGGTVGAIAGMQFFRHKTKHMKFKFGIHAILIVQLVILYWFVK